VELAVSPTSPGVPAAGLVDLCRRAEQIGYQDAWLAEVSGPETFALAGAIAGATETMSLGVAVVAAANRSPALHAMSAGTVSQLLTGRRFALGIGSSSEVIVEEWHGHSFARPLTQVREAVEGARTALTGGRDYDGATASMRRFPLTSPPLGPVELYVGALGPRMLQLAGAIGDGVCLNLMPPRVVPRQIAEIERGAADAGRDLPGSFGVMARLHVIPGDDVDSSRNLVRQVFGPYFAQPVYNRFLAWCGHPEAAQAIAAGFAARDRAAVAAALTDEIVDEVAVVGPIPRIRERLDEYAEAGLTVAALNIIAPSPEAVLETLEAVRA
jgi:probable F420-dependent oxidoreductase